MTRLLIRNFNLPDDFFKPLRPNAKFVPMSERIRAFVDESQALETTESFSFDEVGASSVDPNVDFHIGFMESAEISLRSAGESPATGRQKTDKESIDSLSVSDEATK